MVARKNYEPIRYCSKQKPVSKRLQALNIIRTLCAYETAHDQLHKQLQHLLEHND